MICIVLMEIEPITMTPLEVQNLAFMARVLAEFYHLLVEFGIEG